MESWTEVGLTASFGASSPSSPPRREARSEKWQEQSEALAFGIALEGERAAADRAIEVVSTV